MKVLIIGGAGQGKLEYVRSRYAPAPDAIGVCGREKAELAVLEKPVIYALHHLVWALLEQEKDAQQEILSRLDTRQDWIILCDEVGGGVVPLDSFTREWRECVGRICCALAQRADRVERVFCGLAQTIKP